MEFFTPLYELFAIFLPSPHCIAKRCCFGPTAGVKKEKKKKKKVLSWKSLNPQECEHSGSSHKQLMGPSVAAGVIWQVAGKGYYKTSHFPRRAEFLVFHGDWGSPTEAEITMHADLREESTHIKKIISEILKAVKLSRGIDFFDKQASNELIFCGLQHEDSLAFISCKSLDTWAVI